MVDPAGWPHFCFIEMSIVSLAVDLGKMDGLAISGAVLTEANIAVGFSVLSMW